MVKFSENTWIDFGGRGLEMNDEKNKDVPEKCIWKQDGDSTFYDSECGESFRFDSAGIEYYNFKYCPFCSKEIEGG